MVISGWRAVRYAGEREQVVDHALHRPGAQHRGPGLDVSQQHPADLRGHRDVGEALVQAARPGPAPGRGVDHAGLEQQLADSGEPVAVGPPGRGRDRHAGRQLGVERVHDRGGQVSDLAAVPGQQHGQALAQHRLGPRRLPAQPRSRGPGGGESCRVTGLDGAGEPGQVLGPDQGQVQPHLPGAGGVADQRPGTRPLQLADPAGHRQRHPRLQVGMAAEEVPGDPHPVTHRPLTQARCAQMAEVVIHQPLPGRREGSGHGGHRGPPASVARAAPYSAASCSTDRCTYDAVVSGDECPISSRSASRSMPAAASSVP